MCLIAKKEAAHLLEHRSEAGVSCCWSSIPHWQHTSLKSAPPLTLLHMHSPCCRSGSAPARSPAGCRSCCSPGPGPSERRACTPGRPASRRSWGTALRCTASSFLRTAVARGGGEGRSEMPGGSCPARGRRGSRAEDICASAACSQVRQVSPQMSQRFKTTLFEVNSTRVRNGTASGCLLRFY